MPPAARVTDMHVCPKVEPGPVPHVGGPILPAGEPTVLIGFMPAARQGDMAVCVGPPDAIAQGEPTVIIGNQPAARLGDPMQHGGVIVLGCPNVLIGSSAQADALHTDLPFCEECARAQDSASADPPGGGANNGDDAAAQDGGGQNRSDANAPDSAKQGPGTPEDPGG